ncbi:MAG: RIP metalloprotease RseP [Saprospiraceae bacterium]
MTTLIIAGQLLLSLTILVTLHEMGHFFPSKWFKTRVDKFYLFFDFLFPISTALPYSLLRVVRNAPEKKITFFSDKCLINIYRTGTDETEYGLGWFPLGGYVKIAGMVDESMDTAMLAQEPQPWEFRSKKPWQRLIIMLGGVTVNFILGIVIFGFLLFAYGEKYIVNSSVKDGIYADSLGMKLGLRTGDKIVSVNEKPFVKFDDNIVLKEIVINNAQNLVVERAGQAQTLSVPQDFSAEISSYKNKDKDLFTPRFPFLVGDVANGKAAKAAGVQKGDRFISLNGQPMEFADEFRAEFQKHKNENITVGILRNESETITTQILVSPEGTIGIAFPEMTSFFEVNRQKYSLLEAFPAGTMKGVNFINDQLKAFGQMFKGKIKASESLGGLGSMAKMFSPTWDWEHFWRMTAILSFVLAFMNLLPIPGLDGGYVVFLLYEMVSGRKPNDKVVERATSIGLMLLLGLMLYANGLDIVRGFFAK